jgi:transcriptional regulator with XRE-family HTH domain
MTREQRDLETRAVGRRIKDERVRAGYSRSAFAKLLGWTPKQVSRYEMGFKISDHRLAQVAQKLNVSYDYLKTGEGDRLSSNDPTPVGIMSAPLSIVVMPYAELERMIRRIITEVLESED